jgi:hypothetical protein
MSIQRGANAGRDYIFPDTFHPGYSFVTRR